ncbi:PIG-L family deacetylase [Candidatus Gottesmanbacteria bacterium]|nr:PIG-L family deacetylase [Candidatus Gottesmanbacteria bacterium]
MRKNILCVIAHPDDEAFGPSGTLARLSKKHDVHIVCVTDGASDVRFHPTGSTLAAIRSRELQASAKIIGAKTVHFLGYKDGSLCNNLYHEVAQKIDDLCASLGVVLLLTIEPRGVSGHIDHVAVSMISTFVYEKRLTIAAVWYYCITKQVRASIPSYFIHFPDGYERQEIDMVVDISGVLDQKIAAIKCHASQAQDVERLLRRIPNFPKEECFLVRSRSDKVITVQ